MHSGPDQVSRKSVAPFGWEYKHIFELINFWRNSTVQLRNRYKLCDPSIFGEFARPLQWFRHTLRIFNRFQTQKTELDWLHYSTVVWRCPCPLTLSPFLAFTPFVMHQTNFLHTVKFYFNWNGIAIQKFYPFSSSLNVSCCSRRRRRRFFLFPFTFFGRRTATSYI